jgi:hypothetical protein
MTHPRFNSSIQICTMIDHEEVNPGMQLTADIHIEELLEQHPHAAGFLADRGIVCIRCGEPYWGTLRELAGYRNLPDQVDLIVADLSAYLGQHTP